MIRRADVGCLGPPPAALRRTLYAGWREIYGCWYPPSPPGKMCAPAMTLHGYPPPGPAACLTDPAGPSWFTVHWLALAAVIVFAAIVLAAWLIARRGDDA